MHNSHFIYVFLLNGLNSMNVIFLSQTIFSYSLSLFFIYRIILTKSPDGPSIPFHSKQEHLSSLSVLLLHFDVDFIDSVLEFENDTVIWKPKQVSNLHLIGLWDIEESQSSISNGKFLVVTLNEHHQFDGVHDLLGEISMKCSPVFVCSSWSKRVLSRW